MLVDLHEVADGDVVRPRDLGELVCIGLLSGAAELKKMPYDSSAVATKEPEPSR